MQQATIKLSCSLSLWLYIPAFWQVYLWNSCLCYSPSLACITLYGNIILFFLQISTFFLNILRRNNSFASSDLENYIRRNAKKSPVRESLIARFPTGLVNFSYYFNIKHYVTKIYQIKVKTGLNPKKYTKMALLCLCAYYRLRSLFMAFWILSLSTKADRRK